MKQELILMTIAQDEEAIGSVLRLLNYERRSKKELLSDMNLLLSKAEVGLSTPSLNEDGFIQKEIIEFYKNTNQVGHCFNRK